MRYTNYTEIPRYCPLTSRQVMPSKSTANLDDFRVFFEKMAKAASHFTISLDAKDISAMDKFIALTRGPTREALEKARKAASENPMQKIYDITENISKERQRLLSLRLDEREKIEARINSESNFILPDGTPVGKEETMAAIAAKSAGQDLKPHLVDKPTSPLDILAHNAKVSTDRAQTKPLFGKEAVKARIGPPGMPNLPGSDELLDTLRQDEAINSALKSGITPVSSSDILSGTKSRNYGRK